MTYALAALVLATSLLISGAAPVEAEVMQSLTEADNGRLIDLRVGDAVRVTLPENATTGYRWAIDRLDGIVEAAGSDARYPGGLAGAGGEVTFAFKATRTGNGEVALKYWRHFEGDSSIVKRFGVRLNVRP